MRYTDEEIKKHIVDHLYWDSRIDASNISVEVQQGKAVLRGTVPSYFAAVCARENALSVAGVSEVVDEITVSYPETLTRPTDDGLRSRIVSGLSLNPDFDASGIDIHVDKGVVTLEGSVDAHWQKNRAEYLVSQERGVVAIRNNLAVVPTEDFVDQDIAVDIVAALERNALVNGEAVDVKVKDGIVTLSGVVPTSVARQTAKEAALFTPGVIDVRDELTVAPL
jgi:osmotically-inducible protein OsmY